MKVDLKYQSTGDNDSVEDALIAIANIKTVDGKLIDFHTQCHAIKDALWDMGRWDKDEAFEFKPYSLGLKVDTTGLTEDEIKQLESNVMRIL